MQSAIVTGASTGIGLEISKMLIKKGYRVYGFGRDFTKTDFKDKKFEEVVCDITDTGLLEKEIKAIRKKDEEIKILVNNAGIGHFGPHETLSSKKIHAIIATNLVAPLILTQLLLRDLKKASGIIINIASDSGLWESPFGSVYGATKAGLLHFSRSLFEEVRKSGMNVVAISPGITKTAFFDQLDFREGDMPESYLTPGCIAKAVEFVIDQREGSAVTEMVIRPQRHMITRK
jgi:short-subunit dehydrogenase